MTPSGSGLRLTAAAWLFLAAAVRPAVAHSWVEQLMRIAPNGTLAGAPGYIRGYVSRALPGFSDNMDDYLLPPNGRPSGNTILATDPLCHPSQTPGSYSADFPMLSVSAGDYVALRYQENGHVTLPDTNPTKPLNRGTVYIYGTTQPAADELFADVFQKWTADGTGGNRRGRLLATRNFDDGQCYQVNGQPISQARQAQFKKEAETPQGADLWCQNDIQLPSDLATGSNYTLYWIWSWPTFNKPGSPTDIPSAGFNVTLLQYYTSCMDVAVAGGGGSSSKALANANNVASSFVAGQDLNNAAVLSQLEIGAFQVSVPGASGDSNATSTASASGSAAASTASTASAAAPTSAAANGGHSNVVTVTVTKTQAPVYITVTAPAGGSAAAASSASSSTLTTSKKGRTTHTLTTYSTTFVTETVAPSVGGSSARGSSGGTAAVPATSATSTPAASASTLTPTPGETLTVRPFLPVSSSGVGSTGSARNGTMTTLRRVRRA